MSDDVVRRLYEAPPDGFVAARTAAVAAARRAGDRAAAQHLAGLRKPTVAAWLINLLALRRPELLDELAELAAALRAAQRGLHGDDLRELSMQRRRVTSALVAEVRRLALAADPGLAAGKLPLAEVEETLTAALADADVAAQVRSGRLVQAVSYAGFGEVPRPRLRLVGDEDAAPAADRAARERAAREQREARAARRRELQRELTTARAGETRALRELGRAEAAEQAAAELVADLDRQLAELEQRRSAALADASGRKLARRAAQREAAVARRRVGDVQAALEGLDDAPAED